MGSDRWMSKFSAALLLGASACATMSDVTHGKSNGTTRAYAVTFDEAWSISAAIMEKEGAELEEHRAEGYMLGDIGRLTYRTLMGVWIDRLSDGSTSVTVVTKRRFVIAIFTILTETTFHERFAQAIADPKRSDAPSPPPPTPSRGEARD